VVSAHRLLTQKYQSVPTSRFSPLGSAKICKILLGLEPIFELFMVGLGHRNSKVVYLGLWEQAFFTGQMPCCCHLAISWHCGANVTCRTQLQL